MQGLLLKDFYNLKKTMGLLAVMLVVFGVVFIPQGGGLFAGMAILMGTTLTISTMSYDHMAKWDVYALSMPVSRRQMVGEKYLFMLIAAGAGTLIALAGEFVRLASTGASASAFLDGLLQTVLILSVGLLFGSLMLPLIFKFGVEKARLVMLLSLCLPLVVVWGGGRLVQRSMYAVQPASWLDQVIVLLPVAAAAALGISYLASVRIFEKKEL